jgi:hypothetical protein
MDCVCSRPAWADFVLKAYFPTGLFTAVSKLCQKTIGYGRVVAVGRERLKLAPLIDYSIKIGTIAVGVVLTAITKHCHEKNQGRTVAV